MPFAEDAAAGINDSDGQGPAIFETKTYRNIDEFFRVIELHRPFDAEEARYREARLGHPLIPRNLIPHTAQLLTSAHEGPVASRFFYHFHHVAGF